MPKLCAQYPLLDKWMRNRKRLQERLAVVKEIFVEYNRDPNTATTPFRTFMAQPLQARGFNDEDIRFFAHLPEINRVSVYADLQARLWFIPICTDDNNNMLALGWPVFTRLLCTWDEVNTAIGCMLSPAKRQIGTHMTWIGGGLLLPG